MSAAGIEDLLQFIKGDKRENGANLGSLSRFLSEFIQDSYKVNAGSVAERRIAILKFLQVIGANSEEHCYEIDENNYEDFLNLIFGDEDLNLDEYRVEHDWKMDMDEFNKRKVGVSNKKQKELDFIKNFDQQRLNQAEFEYKIPKTVAGFGENIEIRPINTKIVRKKRSEMFRLKQMKLGYLLIDLQNFKFVCEILRILTSYPEFLPAEKDFLVYLVLNTSNKDCFEILVENFQFVFELVLIDISKNIIAKNSLDQTRIEHLEKIANANSSLKHIFNEIAGELYILSYCNNKLEKLHNLFK